MSPAFHAARHAKTRFFGGLLIAAALVAGCRSERSYEVRGRVAGFGDDARTLIVEHEDIPGLMPAMTMPLEVRDSTSLVGLESGDAVGFDLILKGDESWIENVSRLADDAVAEHPAGRPDPFRSTESPILDRGDRIPDAELLTQADTTLRLSQLRGKRVLMTFIYTSCPIPDFCPLMSRRFAQVQSALEGSNGPPVHLLSISFDPSTDTPAVLRSYAARYTDDLANWTFATGDSTTIQGIAERFGVFYSTNSDQIIHNLVTVLIDEEGVVRALWRGNDWQASDVMGELRGGA